MEPREREELRAKLAATATVVTRGKVKSADGLTVRFAIPGVRIGDLVYVRRRGSVLRCEVVGFADGDAVAMPLGSLLGVGPGDEVESEGQRLKVQVSEALLGRIVDGLGHPKDGLPIAHGCTMEVEREPPDPLERRPIEIPITTGVRVLDGLLTVGEGQRVGLFAGSGVGKSTLLGAIARGVEADIVIVALVGERGREVGEFLEHSLGPEGRKKSIVVVATSDATAIERLRAAQVATTYAEFFRDQGKRVMLLVDSVTRFCRAQREVGLAAGEPPARRGYPPSVFAMLPRLLERSGQGARGSITAVYTVLVEGGDMEEPIADEVRGILDGHVVMDRAIAERGQYPAVNVSGSLSRVMDRVTTPAHRDAARRFRAVLNKYEANRDLITIGEYKRGTDASIDEAILKLPKMESFLKQDAALRVELPSTLVALNEAIA